MNACESARGDRLFLIVAVVATAITAMPATAAQSIRVFANTSDTGDWTTAAWGFNPTPPAVSYPRDTSTYAYEVSILGPSGHITVNAPNITVSQVKIDANAQLHVDSTNFTVSDSAPIIVLSEKEALIVDGELNIEPNAWMKTGFTNLFYADNTLWNRNRINLNATAVGSAVLQTEGGFTNASGAEIVMTDVPGNQLDGETDSGSSLDPWLTNDGVIQGAGVIKHYWGAAGHDGVTNNGSILADGANAISFVSNGTVDNKNIMRGTGAGGFVFQTGAFTNTGSAVIELIGSRLEMGATATLTGGSVEMSGTSALLFHGSTGSFDINVNSGSTTIQNASPAPVITGALTNAAGATLTVQNEFTLVGTMTNHGDLVVEARPLMADRIDNDSNVTIDWNNEIVIAAGDVTHSYAQTAGTTTLKSATIDASLAGGGIQVSGGMIEGEGTLMGNVMVSGTGSIDPGFSYGTIIVDGGFRMMDGTLHMEIGETGGLPEHDFIGFQRPAQYLGGTIEIDFVGGFTPDPTDTFQLFDYVMGFSGSPSVVVNAPYNAIISPDGQTFSFTLIPEPATLALLAIGACALAPRRRNHRMS